MACSSLLVRHIDIVVPCVPPGVKFEARFHGGTLLRVEEISRSRSPSIEAPSTQYYVGSSVPFEDPSPSQVSGTGNAAVTHGVLGEEAAGGAVGAGEEVHVRLHLPRCSLGVARIEAVWSDGPCRNMTSGAGFPVLLLPDEATANQVQPEPLNPKP